MDCSPPDSPVQEIFSSINSGVGYHLLLQGIFLTQELNPCLLCLLHWQVDSLALWHLGISKNTTNAELEFIQITKEITLCL